MSTFSYRTTRLIWKCLAISCLLLADGYTLEFSDCITPGNDRFVLLDEPKKTAQESQTVCQGLGGNLARMVNELEFNLALGLLEDHAIGEEVWIGLFDDGTSGFDARNGRRFGFFGGFEDESIEFFATGRSFPWRSSQPNNLNQHCVAWELDEGKNRRKWSDFPCNRNNLRGLCRIPCKGSTFSPSISPSQKPTTFPTSFPSIRPSNSPTSPPLDGTTAPTIAPTYGPSLLPTSSPSVSTNAPSASPVGSSDEDLTKGKIYTLEMFLASAGTISFLMVGSAIWLFSEKRDVAKLQKKLRAIELQEELDNMGSAQDY